MDNHQQDKILALMKKEKNRRMFERFQSIHLHFQGMKIKDIAKVIGRTEKTVSQYIHAYKAKGIDGLTLNHSPGAPARLSDEQQKQFKQTIVEKLPCEVKFTSRYNWTLQLMRDYVYREYGVTYSLQGIADLAHRLDLSYTKPTYTLAAADKEKQLEFSEITFPELKKTRNRGNRPPVV